MKVALAPACFPGGGGGHVVRCLALARALERRGAHCAFVVEPLGADVLRRMDWASAVAVADNEEARLAALVASGAAGFVVDDYRLGAAFEVRLHSPVLAIDDLADRPHACSLLLDAAYGRVEDDYRALAPGARLLLGPDYALLREGFANPEREFRDEVDRVFVCFGLADPEGITARAVRLLRPLAPNAVFDVALGWDASSLPELRRLAGSDPGLRLHLDADTAPLMHASDLGVGAGGGMVWERRAANLPQLVVALANNQRPMASRLAANGVIALVDLDEPDFERRLVSAFEGLQNPAARRAQLDNPNARCDGLGADRAAEALLSLL